MTKRLMKRMASFYDDIESDRPYKRVKVVAFVVYKNKILSFGVNSEKTSLYQHRMRARIGGSYDEFVYDKTHAEIAAIKKIHPQFDDWRHVELFIVSKKKDGNFRFSRPCPICEQAIRRLGVKRIYYTDSFNGITEESYIER